MFEGKEQLAARITNGYFKVMGKTIEKKKSD